MLSIVLVFIVFLLLALVFGLRLFFHKKPLSSSCGGSGINCICETKTCDTSSSTNMNQK